MKEFTIEQKQQIATEYADKTNKVEDIRNKHHISGASLSAIILEMGGQMRVPNACKPRDKKSKVKVCPNCRKKIEIKGARFCPFCAADIRNEKDILLEKAQKIYSVLQYAPNNEAESARQTITDIINYIKKGD